MLKVKIYKNYIKDLELAIFGHDYDEEPEYDESIA